MGEGRTTWSLHDKSEEGMRSASHLTANADVGVGFGARISNAFREAEILVQSEAFLAMLESLPEMVKVATGSRLRFIVANFYYSLSGAVGAAIIPVVAPPILRALSKFGVVVNTRFNALGPDTFAGVSKRARKTAASALANNMRMVLNRTDRTLLNVPMTLELHNLPPFLDDLKSRNELLLLDSIASHCMQMEHYRNVDTPNHANTHTNINDLGSAVQQMTPLPLTNCTGETTQPNGSTGQDLVALMVAGFPDNHCESVRTAEDRPPTNKPVEPENTDSRNPCQRKTRIAAV